MKTNNRLTPIIAAAVGCLLIATLGYGQNTEIGKLEATAQAGIVGGIGTHASLGISAGTAVNDKVFVLGDLSWIPLGGSSTTISSPNNFFEVASGGRILTFTAGAHYQLNPNRSFIPYLGGGLGLLHSSGSVTQTLGGVTTETSFHSNDVYLSLGGGARYYVSERWGFKPELMFFLGDESFVRFGAGIFYQFGR